MERKGYIGSSDIGIILGLSQYKTPLQLWMEKTGKINQPDLSENEAVQMGIYLEEPVAKLFTKKTGKEVRRAPKIYQHKEYDWMRCQIDRLITGTDELLEVKTASLRKESAWAGDEIPADYLAQIQWQLMVTGKPSGYICVLIGGQKFVYKQVIADAEFRQIMIERAKQFWQMVQDGVPPMAVLGDDDALLALHPKSDDQIQALQEFEVQIARRQELSAHIDEMEKEKELIEVKIKEAIGDNLGLKTEKYKVLWTPTKTTRVDAQKVKDAGMFEQFCTTTETRRLTVKLNKQEK